MRVMRSSELAGWLELEDYLLLSAVVLLPWAFGGVELWAYRLASLLLASAGAVALAKRGWSGLGLDRNGRWLLPAFLLGAWAAFQLVPLPPPALSVLSPEADRIYRDTFPDYPGRSPADLPSVLEQGALDRVPEVDGRRLPDDPGEEFGMSAGGRWSGWRPISLQPSATAERLFWYLALLIGFLVARVRTSRPELAERYRWVMFALFAGLALFALLQAATWNGQIYWRRAVPPGSHPFGPYVNYVHFGGAMELAAPWLVGWTLMSLRERGDDPLWKGVSPVAAGVSVLCLVAGLATASRAVALLLPLSLTLLALFAVRRWWSRLIVLAAAVATWSAAALLLVRTALGQRMEAFLASVGQLPVGGGRLASWRAATAVFRDFPVTGSGFGTFAEAFPAYLPPGEFGRWKQLHNDYLELLLDGGLVAGVLVAWLVAVFVRRAFRGLRPSKGGAYDLAAVGLALGLFSLAAHAFVDFNHQIPANALLFVVAGSMAAAAGETRGERSP